MKRNIVGNVKKWFFSLIAVIIIVYISLNILLVLPSLNNAMTEKQLSDIRKLTAITNINFDNLMATLIDNSEWTDLHGEVALSKETGEVSEFLEELFSENSLDVIGLDYIGIYDVDKNLIEEYKYEDSNIDNILESQGMKYFFSVQPNGVNRVKIASGYKQIDGRAYMYLSHVILNNEGKGDSGGFLLFVKEIDDNYIYRLEIKNNLLLKLYLPSNENKEITDNIIKARREATFYSRKLPEGKKAYYAPYMEGAKKMAYAIEVIVDDEISKEMMLSFAIGLIPIIFLILFAFAMKYLLTKRLVEPILMLYDKISEVKEQKEFEPIEHKEIGNELDKVIDEFNVMMDEVIHQREEIEVKNEELSRLAYIDKLTGLATRRYLDEKYRILIDDARYSNSIISIVMIDVDFFKRYNDTYGHLKGDKILRLLGKSIKRIFKDKGDIIARYGGEEFIIVLYNISLNETVTLIEKLQKLIRSVKVVNEKAPKGYLSISVGVRSTRVNLETDPQKLIGDADTALYKAKKSGRDRYEIY